MSEATVWVKSSDGKYSGRAVEEDGSILSLGKKLLSEHRSAGEARSFIGDAEKVGQSVMRMEAKEHDDGAYVYVFDEAKGVWLFGLNEGSELEKLLKFIER